MIEGRSYSTLHTDYGILLGKYNSYIPNTLGKLPLLQYSVMCNANQFQLLRKYLFIPNVFISQLKVNNIILTNLIRNNKLNATDVDFLRRCECEKLNFSPSFSWWNFHWYWQISNSKQLFLWTHNNAIVLHLLDVRVGR